MGRWLRANLLDQRELRDQLNSTLNGGKEGWNDDEPAVVEVACQLAVRRFFPADYDVRDVTAFVSELRLATGYDASLQQLKIEAVIRSALGETDVVTYDITPGQKYHMRIAVIAMVTQKLGFDEAGVDEMITEAERIAFERGWHPPLAE
jgi:hypothetical protein